MAKDKNGRELKRGDEVTMHFRVTESDAWGGANRVGLEAIDPGNTGESPATLYCHGGYTLKGRHHPAPAQAPTTAAAAGSVPAPADPPASDTSTPPPGVPEPGPTS